MFRRLSLFVGLFALLALASTAQAATIWTPITSGTTSTISSIVYQSPTRFWYATTDGTIARWNGTAFTAGTGITPGENFVDLAFQPGGADGYAVTSNGHVWRSTDGGVTWSPISAPTTRADCGPSASTAESELNAVQWANSTTVYLIGNNSTILRSVNADAGSPTFTEVNKVGTGTCSVQNQASTPNMTDATFLPANPADALFVDQNFGGVYQSSTALSATVSGTRAGETVNNFTGNPRIAQDPANPNRLWVVDHEPGGGGCGTLCLSLSTDGGNTSTAAKFANDSSVVGGLYDISSQNGVEVTAGSGGEIFTSLDGTNFYNQPAGGALAAENWRAEAAYDAQHAVVGGENGALAITSAANTIPDTIAPRGTISGPTTVTSGNATTYRAVVADNTGGSGIDPSGYTWTAPGFPARQGATATYTFPRGVGEVTLTLAFADNAGNHGTATLEVTVKDAPPPGTPTGSKPPPPSAGSESITARTGGAMIKIFKIVTVSGRSARLVPVIVSATKPRKFTVQILPLKSRKKALATGRLTLEGKKGGHGTIRVMLPAKVKPGTYYIVVRETTLKGTQVGKLLKFKFTLK